MNKNVLLDKDLDQYSATARTVLGLKRPPRRLGEVALYTAAAGSALALAPCAEASIIYSGVQNTTVHRVSNGTSSQSVDLDGNGIADLALQLKSHNGATAQFDSARLERVGQTLSVLDVPAFALQKFAASTANIGAPKSASFKYVSFGSARFHQQRSSGNVTSARQFNLGPGASVTGFAGFRFQSKSNTSVNPNYGWLQLKLDVGADGRTDDLTLMDYAYQTVPGEAIHVGTTRTVPEPAGLGLMALGVVGIEALRRRRNRDGNRSAPIQ